MTDTFDYWLTGSNNALIRFVTCKGKVGNRIDPMNLLKGSVKVLAQDLACDLHVQKLS